MPAGDLYSVTYPNNNPLVLGKNPLPGGILGKVDLMAIEVGNNPIRIHRIHVTCPVITGGGNMCCGDVVISTSVPIVGPDIYEGGSVPNGAGVINHINWGAGAATQNTPTFRAWIQPSTPPGYSGIKVAISYFEESFGWYWVPAPEERPTLDATGSSISVWFSESAVIPGTTAQCSMIVEEL